MNCSRRDFLKGAFTVTATTAAGALLAACAGEKAVAEASKATIPVGGAQIIDGWVVAQPSEGEFVAFSTVCPHARGEINEISQVNGVTVAICPKHHSVFDVSDGSVVEGPARDPLQPAGSVESAGDTVKISS